jgi:hypothetical protein
MGVFKFGKDEITDHILYEMKLFKKVKEPLNYIFKTLEENGHSLTLKSLDKKINLNKVKQNERKNYNWSVINYKNVKMLIRSYQQHLTIYTKVTKPCEFREKDISEFAAFTFHSNMKFFNDDKHDEMLDTLYDNPFFDLNQCIKQMLEVIIERGTYWVQNSACLKVPKHVEIKLAFDNDQIHGVDNFIFCMEEIDSLHCQLFAENTMFKKLGELKKQIGKDFGSRYKIKEVRDTLKNNYYHGVGLVLSKKDNEKETEFKDVYCLTRHYYENIFDEAVEEND